MEGTSKTIIEQYGREIRRGCIVMRKEKRESEVFGISNRVAKTKIIYYCFREIYTRLFYRIETRIPFPFRIGNGFLEEKIGENDKVAFLY
jgi:hypothetical protein